MKTLKLAAIIAIVTLIFSSCKKEISGSGHFISETRNVEGFTEVVSSGDFSVVLKEDSLSHIELIGEDNILPEIKTIVSGNQLKIYYDNHHIHYDHSGVTIVIYNPVYTTLDLQGSGKIASAAILHASTINLNISGSGVVDCQVDCDNISTNVSGSGKILLSGISPMASHKIGGSGKIKAFDLQSEIVQAAISGSGTCEVFVNTTLMASISGSGKIIYRGTPQVFSNVSGSGTIRPD